MVLPMFRRTFVVVVIDDKDGCCQRICDQIAGHRKVGGREITVIATPVHIRLVIENSPSRAKDKKWTFSPQVGSALREAASVRPDLLLVDYGYIDENEAATLKKKGREIPIDPAEIRGKLLNPIDLRKWVDTTSELDDQSRAKVISNIFDFSGPLHLYTYTPVGLERAVGSVEERKNRAAMAFPKVHGSMISVDTRDLLYANNEFDTLYDSGHYGFLMGMYFDKIIQNEISHKLLYESKFLRIKKTIYSVAAIGAMGAGIALASSVVGSLIFEYLNRGRITEAFILAVASLIITVPVGASIALLFERLMWKLVPDD